MREAYSPEGALDHRELLRKYINHVAAAEGTTFTDHLPHTYSDEVFTEAEIAELQRLAR